MEVSKDQNFVEIGGVKGEFAADEEARIRCCACCFASEEGTTWTFECHKTPCSSGKRNDGMAGCFKKVEE